MVRTCTPAEVEAALEAHPEVAEAGVAGVSDAVWGQRVVAAVVLRQGGGVSAEAMLAFCRERVSGFKVPKQVVFLAELPRTASGKLLRRELRRLFGAANEESVSGRE